VRVDQALAPHETRLGGHEREVSLVAEAPRRPDEKFAHVESARFDGGEGRARPADHQVARMWRAGPRSGPAGARQVRRAVGPMRRNACFSPPFVCEPTRRPLQPRRGLRLPRSPPRTARLRAGPQARAPAHDAERHTAAGEPARLWGYRGGRFGGPTQRQRAPGHFPTRAGSTEPVKSGASRSSSPAIPTRVKRA
jgi:hypothetical protein